MTDIAARVAAELAVDARDTSARAACTGEQITPLVTTLRTVREHIASHRADWVNEKPHSMHEYCLVTAVNDHVGQSSEGTGHWRQIKRRKRILTLLILAGGLRFDDLEPGTSDDFPPPLASDAWDQVEERVATWNDAPGRTVEHVLDLLDRALALTDDHRC